MVLTKDRDRERGVSSLEAESYNDAIYSRSEDQVYSNDDEPWENICILCLGACPCNRIWLDGEA